LWKRRRKRANTPPFESIIIYLINKTGIVFNVFITITIIIIIIYSLQYSFWFLFH